MAKSNHIKDLVILEISSSIKKIIIRVILYETIGTYLVRYMLETGC